MLITCLRYRRRLTHLPLAKRLKGNEGLGGFEPRLPPPIPTIGFLPLRIRRAQDLGPRAGKSRCESVTWRTKGRTFIP